MEENKIAWTYGFEIEGVFSKDIYKTLSDLGCQLDRKGDGSVHWGEICGQNNLPFNVESSSACEYNVGIFNNEEELYKAMEVFKNKKNYWNDYSCGLHLHIKPKKQIKENKELFWDLDLIKKLEKFSYSSLCDCVKGRKDSRWCFPFVENGDLVNHIHGQAHYENDRNVYKYRFCRNHPSGTIEFRFFSPCEHKVENVKKFLAYLDELLKKQKHKKHALITLDMKDEETIRDFNYSLCVAGDKNYNFRLGEKFNEGSTIKKTTDDSENNDDHDYDCDCDMCVENRERDRYEDDSDNGDGGDGF